MTALSAPVRFGLQSYFAFKAFSWNGLTAFIWNSLARPVMFVTMFALMGRFAGNPEAAQAYIIGMVAAAHPASIMGGILPIFSAERNANLLPSLFVSSGSRLAMLWSRGILHMANGWLSVVTSLAFAIGVLRLEVAQLDWLTLLVATLLIGLSSTAFALFAGNFALILREWVDLRTFLEGTVVALTGAVIPLAVLPGAVAVVAQWLPMTAGLFAFRAAFEGAPLTATAGPLLREAAIALGYAVLGVSGFKVIEWQAKRLGSLDWEG